MKSSCLAGCFYFEESAWAECSHLNWSSGTIERFEYFFFDGFHRFHYVFFWFQWIFHRFIVGADLSFMVIVRLCFNFFIGVGFITVSGKLLDAFANAGMILFVLEYLIKKIADSWGKGIVIIFSVAVDGGIAMLDGCFIAVKGDFFNVLSDVLNEVVWIEFEELNEVLLFEGTYD